MTKFLEKATYAIIAEMLIVQGAFAVSQITGGNPQNGSGIKELDNPIAAESLNDFIGNIIEILLLLAAPILVCVFIWIGLRFVLAQGKPGEIEKVKGDLLWTLIGAAIVLGAYGIKTLVTGTLGSIVTR